jgi:hypothetical protein
MRLRKAQLFINRLSGGRRRKLHKGRVFLPRLVDQPFQRRRGIAVESVFSICKNIENLACFAGWEAVIGRQLANNQKRDGNGRPVDDGESGEKIPIQMLFKISPDLRSSLSTDFLEFSRRANNTSIPDKTNAYHP